MKGYVWYVISRNVCGGNVAVAQRISRSHNLVGFATIDGITSMNACNSKKEAQELANFWNECYIKNGSASSWITK